MNLKKEDTEAIILVAMAATTTTAATVAYATGQNSFTLLSPTQNYSVSRLIPYHKYCSSNNATRRQIINRALIRTTKICSTGLDGNVSDTTTTAEEEGAIELPEEPPSLISALNVERALRGLAITEVDYYGILNLPRGCSYDQVTAAYNKKIEELKSMNQMLDEDEFSKQYNQLKESYSILSSVEERRLYDWSLARVGKADKYMWPYEVDITQIPSDPDDPPSQEPEDIGPTRATGYFILGWFVLSMVFLVVLNTI